MFNEKIIQGVIIFSGITIILILIPLMAYFMTTILTIIVMWLGSLFFSDDIDNIISIISIFIFIIIVISIEYRYISDISRSFFRRRLSKQEQKDREDKKELKEKKMEGLFDTLESIASDTAEK
ncbi:MAG: hypothetical protein ACTSYA_05060 [Candidatus Kariarchaeaceae archaeon]